MYSCLIIFWSKTCDYYSPSMKTSCRYRLHALAILNASIILLLLALPFLTVFLLPVFSFLSNLVMILFSLVLLTLFLIEGSNVYKFLGTNPTEPSSAQHAATIMKMKMTTKLIINSSGFWLFAILVLAISTAIRIFVRLTTFLLF
jgi:hypothetical protein